MSNRSERSSIFLHVAIGFLSLLLAMLMLALIYRVVVPRIESERDVEDPILISDIIQLEVLNGCGVPGLANRFTTTLRRHGFDVVESGNFDHFNMEETILVSRNGDQGSARRIARALGLPPDRIVTEASGDFFLDATLVIGADFESLELD
ncbi:MAG: LytR C-terminal domain-containing protein [Bacteroidota bacterium]